MKDFSVAIYARLRDLPGGLSDTSLFHSRQLFALYERASRMTPFMVVATDASGRIVAQLLAVVRYRWLLFPPFFYGHCYVSGEGWYAPATDAVRKTELFGEMLQRLVRKMRRRVFYIEFANLSAKMFGYREFRRAGFFPVRWLSVHNSLHSKDPLERLDERTRRRIERGRERGVETSLVATDADFDAFMSLMRRHNLLKPRRYIPSADFFRGLMDSRSGRLFITRYKDKVIGCCACVYSGSNAYYWYSASLRKTYVKLHPDTLTLWAAIRYAHREGYDHFVFMDVGLPFHRNPFRTFILRFGGKPVSTFRWFRNGAGWLNRLLSLIYRD